MAETKRATGTVKWFSAQKGFGFIAPDDGCDDLFVHQTSIQSDGFRTLSDGQLVEFAVDVGEDGRTKAVDVLGVGGSRRVPRGGGGRGFYSSRGRGGNNSGGGGYGRGGRGGRSGGRYVGEGEGGGGGGVCFKCGRHGHLARDCYAGGRSGGGRGGRRYGGGGCYNCGDEGHFARECPNSERK